MNNKENKELSVKQMKWSTPRYKQDKVRRYKKAKNLYHRSIQII